MQPIKKQRGENKASLLFCIMEPLSDTYGKQFNKTLDMPETLSEVGITDEQFDEMASEAVRTSGLSTRAYVRLQSTDVRQILQNCR